MSKPRRVMTGTSSNVKPPRRQRETRIGRDGAAACGSKQPRDESEREVGADQDREGESVVHRPESAEESNEKAMKLTGVSTTPMTTVLEAQMQTEMKHRDKERAERYVATVRPAMAALGYVHADSEQELTGGRRRRMTEEGGKRADAGVGAVTEEGEGPLDAGIVAGTEEGGGSDGPDEKTSHEEGVSATLGEGDSAMKQQEMVAYETRAETSESAMTAPCQKVTRHGARQQRVQRAAHIMEVPADEAAIIVQELEDEQSHSHCKKKNDKLNLVILKVNSKREKSLRALVDCGASNNFVRLQSGTRLDFEEVKVPRSLLEVRLATGVVVKTEKRVVRVRFSYEEKKFVDELVVLDLDDKFDMVLGMPWLGQYDPVIDWAKRTIVRFRTEAARGAAASDLFALFARTLTTERVVREKCEPNQKTQIQSDLMGSQGKKSDAIVSTVAETRVEQEWAVTEGSDLGASAPGADVIGPNINGRSVVRRREKRGASAPGADAASSADGFKRSAPEMLACSRAAGLLDKAVRNQAGFDCVRPREDPSDEQKYVCSRAAGQHDEAKNNQAGLECVRPRSDPAGDQTRKLSTAGPGSDKTRGTEFYTRKERRKRARLPKSRSGTETLQAVSAGKTQQLETTVETLSILTLRLLPKRDWISLGVGIHGSRTGPVRDTTVPDEVESPPLRGLDNGPASASGLSLPLRERFELKASESSSRGRRDPTLGSTLVEDEVPSSSSSSSMSTSFAWESLASSPLK
ncbi:unnamed protein product [Phytophthora fragariaefolia]|uniref:Unnamed protein product n=1 Tax=Phytophthora fragariaefolia TaxID=1490495 RepID=A0A9W6XKC5_9STRA|nr:unnamed protein product [Phytophthora fragariaefolia]